MEEINKNKGFSHQIKKWLTIALILSVILEMFFFPSFVNFAGCIMTCITWFIYSKNFTDSRLIVRYPFAYIMFMSMFLYRYLPLFFTLIEGKPISYGFEMGAETFLYETILFLVSSLAFYMACKDYKKTVIKNNALQKFLYKIGFYNNYNAAVLWGLGFFGLAMRLLHFSTGQVEYGDAGGKFLSALQYLMYAPMCLLFPKLLGFPETNKKWVNIYVISIFVLNIASNSRQAIITPLATYALLFVLNMLRNKIDFLKLISPAKLIIGGLAIIYLLGVLSDLSLAMLATRTIRKDVSKGELFSETISIYQDEQQMQKLRNLSETVLEENGGESEAVSYKNGWDESYIDNFMVNRYANLRITDQILYYVDIVGWNSEMMQTDFYNRIFLILPTPVLTFFNIELSKEQMAFSRADLISSSPVRGRRVTSHVGDGLATFGIWYFPIQFILFYVLFKLLNCISIFNGSVTMYSAYGLMNLFSFLALFRNANGCLVDLGYILRGFWEGLFTYLVVLFVVKRISLFLKK